LYIPHESLGDGLSGPKHVVSGIIKIFVRVKVTPSVLTLSAINMLLWMFESNILRRIFGLKG
jgi:hypothetical protein